MNCKFTLAALLLVLCSTRAEAQFIPTWVAYADGNWDSPGIWSQGTRPPALSNVRIGATSPSAARHIATVGLTQDETTRQLVLGIGGGTQGTLNLNGNVLTAASIQLGNNVGTVGSGLGTINQGSGHFQTTDLTLIKNNSLTYVPGDVSANLVLIDGSSATTAGVGNITADARLTLGSTLNLGANLILTGGLGINGSTVHANGFDVTALDLSIGEAGNAGQLLGVDQMTVTRNLSISVITLALDANDSVGGGVFARDGGTLTLHAATAVQDAQAAGGTLNTVATSNVTATAGAFGAGGVLNLGADLVLTGGLQIRGNGASPATVNANGFDITVMDLSIGEAGGAGALVGADQITVARNLSVSIGTWTIDDNFSVAGGVFAQDGGTLTLHPTTAVPIAQATSGGTLNTVVTSNVTASAAALGAGSTLNLGADLALTGDLQIFGGDATPATVNANGFDVTARDISIGEITNFGNAGALVGADKITATRNLIVSRSAFTLDGNDSVGQTVTVSNGGTLTLDAATVAQHAQLFAAATLNTVATSNLPHSVDVLTRSTLNLGADLVLTGALTISGVGAELSTVNANGFNVTAQSISIGAQNGGAGALVGAGQITASNLYVRFGSHTLNANDSVQSVEASDGGTLTLDAATAVTGATILSGGTINTAAASNISKAVIVSQAGSTLNLGADLAISDFMQIRGDGGVPATVNANGFDVTATSIELGLLGEPGELLSAGAITVNRLTVGLSNFVFHDGDDTVLEGLTLNTGTIVTVLQSPNDVTGLTLGDGGSGLQLPGTSVLDLEFDDNNVLGLDWAFRWENPLLGGNRVAAINALISSGRIAISAPMAVSVFDNEDGFTYVGYVNNASFLAGDYNDDGSVNAADYVLWRKLVGTTAALPNDPHGGTIGEDQYAAWRNNFGAALGGGSSQSHSVPEPTAWSMLFIATVVSTSFRWARLRAAACTRAA